MAKDYISEVFKEGDDHYDAYVGDIRQEKRYNLAVNEYKKAIQIKKDFAYYYYNLGCAYLGLKDYTNAKNAFEKAVKIQPQTAEFYYNLAFSLKNLNKEKEMNKVLEEYKKIKDSNY